MSEFDALHELRRLFTLSIGDKSCGGGSRRSRSVNPLEALSDQLLRKRYCEAQFFAV
jgi:hypothetical protein